MALNCGIGSQSVDSGVRTPHRSKWDQALKGGPKAAGSPILAEVPVGHLIIVKIRKERSARRFGRYPLLAPHPFSSQSVLVEGSQNGLVRGEHQGITDFFGVPALVDVELQVGFLLLFQLREWALNSSSICLAIRSWSFASLSLLSFSVVGDS